MLKSTLDEIASSPEVGGAFADYTRAYEHLGRTTRAVGNEDCAKNCASEPESST